MSKNQKEEEVGGSLKVIAKTSIFIFVTILFSKVLFYFYRIIIARDFGPSVYGTFSLASMVFVLVISISSFGFFEGLLRFVPLYRGTKKMNNIRYLFKFSVWILTLSSIFFGLILFFSSEFISINLFHEPNLVIFLKILSLAMPFYMIGSVFLCLIRGFERIKMHSFISEFFQILIKLIFLILLIFLGVKVNSVPISYFIGILSVFLVAYLYCRYKLPEVFQKYILKKQIKKQIRKIFFLYSLPLIFSNILYDLFGYMDSFVIGLFKDTFNVGIYNAAFPIASLMAFVPSLFLQILFPMIVREFSKKRIDIMRELIKQVQKWILIINLPFFSLMFLFSGAFINLFFGAQYMAAEPVLRILSIGFFFYSLSDILGNLILVVGKSKTFLINIIILSVFNLVLNVLLIPKYGISGAAFSTTMSYIALAIILFFQVKRYINIVPIRRKMFQILISVAIPSIILFYVRQFFSINIISVILLGSFFILLYILLIFITRSLDRNDFEILKLFKRKFKRTPNKK